MWNLRMKFIQQAEKYFGVPYAKKYFEPGSKLYLKKYYFNNTVILNLIYLKAPEYNSNIFLDCCGLVRRGFSF